MRSTLFVLDKLDLGGLQKVNVEVAKALKAPIFSIQLESSFYQLAVPIYYGERSNAQKYFVRFLKSINLISKVLFKHSSSLVIKYQVRQLVECVKKNNIEVVVLSGPAVLFLKELKKNIPDLKCIIWAHSPYDIYQRNHKMSAELFKQCIQLSDTIVCLTRDDREKYGDKAVVINNPLTIDNTEHSSLEHQMLCFVGRLALQHKGLDYLCVVAKGLPEGWRIAVAGSGKKEDEIRFNELIERYNVREKIILRGALNGEDLRQHYLNSSMFIMTSRWEGFGLVLVEAMSFGLPIVSFDASGPREVLKDGEYGVLIDIGDTDAFSKAISRLILSKEERKEWGAKSLNRVKDFEIASIAGQWKEIIG